MRRSLGMMLLVAAVAGCKNQAGGTFTNPFLTPSRVPPPSTRVLAPGTAQPYYPGDPVPGAAPTTVVPGTVIGAPVATPTTPLPGYATPVPSTGFPTTSPPAGVPTYQGTSQPLTTPPGGWPYPPQSSATGGAGFSGEAVSVPGDPQGLRFAGAGGGTPNQGTLSASVPPVNALAGSPAGGMRLPIQSLLPLEGNGSAPGTGAAGLVAVGNPSPSPSLPGRGSGAAQLAQREVTAAEYFAPRGTSSGATLASAEASPDGFRAQGSVVRADAQTDPGFRSPSGRSDAAASAAGDDSTRFAAGENYESLRGQLEYWPVTGEWSLRYLAVGAADTLGGRVMIENPQLLANLQPGEMVSVRGRLFGQATETGAMQPTYRLSGVQRQRK